MKNRLAEELKLVENDLLAISDHLYENPELGDEEFESMEGLTNYLEAHQFNIEKGLVDRPTAFRATYTSEKRGPTIAYLAEYDALPEVGHGCGHNMIGTMSIGAGIVLSKIVDEIGGTVVVLGTPAEETNGAKVPMSEQGIFDDIDVSMIVHPGGESYESGGSLAMDAIQYLYKGKTSHAAAAPEEGINALDGVLQLFNGINALREHLPSDVRIHGVISEGGKAANVVPDRACAHFYIRASERKRLDKVVKQVEQIAEGSALMTGATVEISHYELSYDDMKTNHALSEAFTKNLQSVDDEPIHTAPVDHGSIDMGNVSQVVPAIHPYISLKNADLVQHTREFAKATISKAGHEAIKNGILSMALTGYDVITDEQLLARIKKEFDEQNNL
ncbi:MAG TPA: M20 family metallopeptidase [Bacillota bacterium]|nr:M20 family metallopeptidase [Bacillota bacterium]